MIKSDKNRTSLFEGNFNNLFEYMTEQHRRVLPVRVDLRFPQGYDQNGDNVEIGKFHKNLLQHYRDKKTEIRYHTVREQVTSENPHYHAMLLVDGDRVRSAREIQKQCSIIWNDILENEGKGLVNYCTPKPGHPIEPLRMVHRPSGKATGQVLEEQVENFESTKEIVSQHAGYLNKFNGKGKAPHRVREVFTSQVRKGKNS